MKESINLNNMETDQLVKLNGNGKEKAKLPSIADLYASDNLPAIHKDSVFQVLVNQDPKPEWVKVHPMTKGHYLPVERVEWLLTNIMVKWRLEIKDSKMIGNSVVVTVRLHYFNHIDNEWTWQDGIGAAPLQTAKGAGAIEWDRLNYNAVQIGAPAAETYAFKDAAEKIGKLFGKDLNRQEAISYESLTNKYAKALSDD
jgi:hypothetical protein